MAKVQEASGSTGADGSFRKPNYDCTVTKTGTVGGTEIRVIYTVIDGVILECYAYPVRK